MEIAKLVSRKTGAPIEVKESNDPRSYRQNSDKIKATGFKQQYGIEDAIDEIITAFKEGKLKEESRFYTVKTMKKLGIK